MTRPANDHDRTALLAELAYLDALPRPELPPCPPWCTRHHDRVSPAAIDLDLNTLRVVHGAVTLTRTCDNEGSPITLGVSTEATETHDLTTGASNGRDVPGLTICLGLDTVTLTAGEARDLAGELYGALTRAADALDAADRWFQDVAL